MQERVNKRPVERKAVTVVTWDLLSWSFDYIRTPKVPQEPLLKPMSEIANCTRSMRVQSTKIDFLGLCDLLYIALAEKQGKQTRSSLSPYVGPHVSCMRA